MKPVPRIVKRHAGISVALPRATGICHGCFARFALDRMQSGQEPDTYVNPRILNGQQAVTVIFAEGQCLLTSVFRVPVDDISLFNGREKMVDRLSEWVRRTL